MSYLCNSVRLTPCCWANATFAVKPLATISSVAIHNRFTFIGCSPQVSAGRPLRCQPRQVFAETHLQVAAVRSELRWTVRDSIWRQNRIEQVSYGAPSCTKVPLRRPQIHFDTIRRDDQLQSLQWVQPANEQLCESLCCR